MNHNFLLKIRNIRVVIIMKLISEVKAIIYVHRISIADYSIMKLKI